MYAEMRELMAKTTNARKDMTIELFAIVGKGSLPQLSTQSFTREVADDDEDIKRYASTCNTNEINNSVLVSPHNMLGKISYLKQTEKNGKQRTNMWNVKALESYYMERETKPAAKKTVQL